MCRILGRGGGGGSVRGLHNKSPLCGDSRGGGLSEQQMNPNVTESTPLQLMTASPVQKGLKICLLSEF